MNPEQMCPNPSLSCRKWHQNTPTPSSIPYDVQTPQAPIRNDLSSVSHSIVIVHYIKSVQQTESNMPLHQTFITATSSIALLSISLGLLNNLYSVTDLTKAKGPTCDFKQSSMALEKVSHTFIGRDDRALLYGSISVLNALLSSLVFALVSIVLVLLARCTKAFQSNLDLESEAKYDGWKLAPKGMFDFYGGMLFRATSAAAMLSALVAGVLVIPALQLADLDYLGASPNETRPDACQDLGRDAFQREDDLDAIFILSLLSALFVGLMIHAVKYDIKASE